MSATEWTMHFYVHQDGDQEPVAIDAIFSDERHEYSYFCEIKRSPMYLAATTRRGERLVLDSSRDPDEVVALLWHAVRYDK